MVFCISKKGLAGTNKPKNFEKCAFFGIITTYDRKQKYESRSMKAEV